MRAVMRGAALALLVVLNGCNCDKPNVNGGGGGGTGGDVGGGTGGDVGGGTGGDVGGGGGTGGSGGTGGMGGTGGTGGTGGGILAKDGGCGLNTCADAGAECGFVGDGCGPVLFCGSCAAPTTCGGGGVANKCGGNSGCVKRTCAGIGATCGPMSDGCGGLLNCGSCALPETCGGGGIASVCGLIGPNVTADGGAVAITCASAGAQCGVIGDGLGGIVTCGGCDAGLCGGGGIPYHCGGGNICVKRTCATADAGCGAVGDGCGGIFSCGSCTAPMTCGGGGQANHCGGGVFCVPRTCTQADATCGQVGDGCGGLIDGGCGTCATGTCGSGGVPNQCGTGGGACVARTCATADAGCGAVGNGCGAILNCGTCASGTCGGGGSPNQCGSPPPCVPKTCAQLNKNCGAVGDGCGGLIAGGCGTCTAPDICGGSGIPSVCGSNIPDGGAACVNLCQKQVACTTGTTTLTGTVYAPTDPALGYGSPDPIPNALVYVPNAPLQPLTLPDGGTPDGGPEVSCDQCSAGVSGSPLVTTYSAVDGTFTLSNVPCGAGVQVPVVIQLGKWRRQVTLSNLTCCAQNMMTADQSRLPRRQFEGSLNDNIPLIAVVTGSADGIENVLPKLGIDEDPVNGQYTVPSGKGRVRFYVDNGFNDPTLLSGGGTVPSAAQLYGDLNEMHEVRHDHHRLRRWRAADAPDERANLETYANRGGRVFASHFAYVWLYGTAVDPNGNNINSPISFTGTATWNPQAGNVPPKQDAYIDISFAQGRHLRRLGAGGGRPGDHLDARRAAHPHPQRASRLRRGHRAGAALGLRPPEHRLRRRDLHQPRLLVRQRHRQRLRRHGEVPQRLHQHQRRLQHRHLRRRRHRGRVRHRLDLRAQDLRAARLHLRRVRQRLRRHARLRLLRGRLHVRRHHHRPVRHGAGHPPPVHLQHAGDGGPRQPVRTRALQRLPRLQPQRRLLPGETAAPLTRRRRCSSS